MTEAMPFLQKTILLSYDPRPFPAVFFLVCVSEGPGAVPEQGDGFPILAYAVDG